MESPQPSRLVTKIIPWRIIPPVKTQPANLPPAISSSVEGKSSENCLPPWRMPVPAGVDGSPLFSLFLKGAAAERPVGRSEEAEATGVAPALTPEEEEALKESLRGLGYL